jgi:3-oxoacyl-[acyl-carrier protein] reductase
MDLRLSGRRALITGGGGGIGGAIASALAAEGVEIAVCDIEGAAAEAATKRLADNGAQSIAVTADVTSKPDVERAITEAESRLGPIDILVNNAGFARDRYLAKMADEEWEMVHNVVLKAAFLCSRAVLPGMMQRKFGRIVNITSMAYLGNAGQTNYSSAKAGLVGFTSALAKEAGPFNITVNAIAPGLIATPRLKRRPDFEKLHERSLANTPLRRLGTPEDIAAAAAFLVSEPASFITGQTIHVAGGR